MPSKSCSENLWIISHGTHLVYTMCTMKLEPFLFDGPLKWIKTDVTAIPKFGSRVKAHPDLFLV